MLELFGGGQHLCDRLSRRQILRAGALAPLGLALPALLAQPASAGQGGSFGRAKQCLMIFMWGGPSHIDLFDMKPNAPAEIRGEFLPAATKVPGIQICEHLPKLAQHVDKLAIVRSLAHSDNNHSTSAHWMLTGHKHAISAENFNAKGDDFPHVGAVVSKLAPGKPTLPTFVALPKQIGTTIGAVTPGQGGGILGKRYDPFQVQQRADDPELKVANLGLPEGFSPARMDVRKELLAEFDRTTRELTGSIDVALMSDYQRRAMDLVTSSDARRAFDVAAESPADKERYGRSVFGQSCLMARRLLEAGVKLVTVYWHHVPVDPNVSWDTHAKNFPVMRTLMPELDCGLDALIEDLTTRGMLDDTLVVWSSEFGRSPKINAVGGRDHWGGCNSIFLAGAGIPGGQVYGASDKIAAKPLTDPVRPADLSATIFHLLGVQPGSQIYDPLNRPLAISDGQPLTRVIGA